MANQVYANNMEISCKAADGKSIACFPDVCFTPPQTAATPTGVPIPYPNTGMAKDTTKGSKTVKISGKEVMLKDKSYFKTSYGDEAGNAPKKGIITSKIKGKVYFTSWSMDVKFEGKSVVRHMDLTTHNHASQPSQTPPHPYLDAAAIGNAPECKDAEKTLDITMQEELPRSRTDGATVAVAVVQGNPYSTTGGASSIGRGTVRRGGKYDHWAEGIQRGERSNVKTCDGKDFVYQEGGRPKQGHAEAKIIEDYFASGAKGHLVIAVSKSPCEHCSRLINEVNKGSNGKNCNKITICESSIHK